MFLVLEAPRTVVREFAFRPPTGSRGGSVIFGGASAGLADPAEPNVSRALGIGLDLHNPKSESPFDANGNIYGRPEREVSLHWDGREIDNRRSPVPLAGATVRVEATEVVGGAEVTVRVDGTAVYDRTFVPFVRLSGGWSANGVTTLGERTALGVTRPHRSVEVPLVHGINDAKNHEVAAPVTFPNDLRKVGRAVATLDLGPTPAGLDPWDRLASLTVTDDRNRTFEVLRCITPYRKGWTWSADVTHLLPVFARAKSAKWRCETWGAGWTVDAKVTLFEGPLRERPVAVVPLWQSTYEIGTGKTPPEPKVIPSGRRMKIFTTVTGHGQAPNTGNAAEFIPLDRTLTVGPKRWTNRLWNDEVYLNPCRPQGGTWKYDRAGWAPGSVVAPWVVELGRTGGPTTYAIAPYVNETPDPGNPARQVIESVLVTYGR